MLTNLLCLFRFPTFKMDICQCLLSCILSRTRWALASNKHQLATHEPDTDKMIIIYYVIILLQSLTPQDPMLSWSLALLHHCMWGVWMDDQRSESLWSKYKSVRRPLTWRFYTIHKELLYGCAGKQKKILCAYNIMKYFRFPCFY